MFFESVAFIFETQINSFNQFLLQNQQESEAEFIIRVPGLRHIQIIYFLMGEGGWGGIKV